jgi:hypothetical protein
VLTVRILATGLVSLAGMTFLVLLLLERTT